MKGGVFMTVLVRVSWKGGIIALPVKSLIMQKLGDGSHSNKRLGVATNLAIMRKSSKFRVLVNIQRVGCLNRLDIKRKAGTRF